MRQPNRPWYMRLTLVNSHTGQRAGIMYPSMRSDLLESLDCCQIPYGSGEYSHLAVSFYGVKTDNVQKELTRIIENALRPPSISELDFLGRQLQQMTVKHRAIFQWELAQYPSADIVTAINTAHHVLDSGQNYDGRSMAERAVLAGDHDPLIRVQLIPADMAETDDPKVGVWLDCPAEEKCLTAAKQAMGVSSLDELTVNTISGTLNLGGTWLIEAFSDFVLFSDVDHMAAALADQGGMGQAAKFKALLNSEACTDFSDAAVLAERLGKYELYNSSELYDRLQKAAPDTAPEKMADDLGFEETSYGCIRKIGSQTLDQQLEYMDSGTQGPMLTL